MDSKEDPPGPPRNAREVREALDVISLFVQECRSCQADVAPHWQFCAHCGNRLATACPGCGSALPPLGSRYCPHCGLELPEELWPSGPQPVA